MQYQRHCTPSKEEVEDEVLTRDGGTIEEKDVSRKFGVTGARLERTLRTTAGAKEERGTSAHEKTKDQLPPAATTAEKKDTSNLTAQSGRRETPYATAFRTLSTEKTDSN
jgi:hypothetical protein